MSFPLFCLLQEKVKAVFDNLIQLDHLNIVKFHKYWADVKENRARVRNPLKNLTFIWSRRIQRHFVNFPLLCFLCAGHFHHRVHVLGKSQTVFKEDKEKPQDHEWKGLKSRVTNDWLKKNPSFLHETKCVSSPTGLEALVHTDTVGSQVSLRDGFPSRLEIISSVTKQHPVSEINSG